MPAGRADFEVFLALLPPAGNDGAHDRTHLRRVWRNAAEIADGEPPCDRELLAAAVRSSATSPTASQLRTPLIGS